MGPKCVKEALCTISLTPWLLISPNCERQAAKVCRQIVQAVEGVHNLAINVGISTQIANLLLSTTITTYLEGIYIFQTCLSWEFPDRRHGCVHPNTTVDNGQDLKISHFPSAQDTQSRTWYCAVSTADAREGLPHGYAWRLAVKSDVERLKGYTLTSYWQMSIHFKKYHTMAVDEVDDDSIHLVELSSLQQPKLQFIPGGLPMYEMQVGPVPKFMTASPQPDCELWKRAAAYTKNQSNSNNSYWSEKLLDPLVADTKRCPKNTLI